MRFLSYAVPPVSPRCSRPFQHSRRPPVAPHAQVFHLEDQLASSPPHRPALSLRLRTASETPMDNQRTLDRLLAYRSRSFVYHCYDPFPENQFPKNSHSSAKRHVVKNLDAVRWRRSRFPKILTRRRKDTSLRISMPSDGDVRVAARSLSPF